MENIDDQNIVQKEGDERRGQKTRLRLFLGVIFFIFSLLIVLWRTLVSSPSNFSANTPVEIPSGYALSKIGILLEDRSVIRSHILFTFLARNLGDPKSIPSGTYLFKDPINVFRVAERIMRGEHGIKQIKVTLPEGITAKEMAKIMGKLFPKFDAATFNSLTREKEGYLFPDTYFFYTNATSGPIADVLERNFEIQTAQLKQEAESKQKDWNAVLSVASLLEEEARTQSDRRIVSGIIWKRLAKNMPLQIDATLGYVTGKGSLELSVADMKKDSPYNTYTRRGLPPTPISNPGLDAIRAALEPEDSPYLYYLSDKKGIMYYAKTFEEHKLNKAQYLR